MINTQFQRPIDKLIIDFLIEEKCYMQLLTIEEKFSEFTHHQIAQSINRLVADGAIISRHSEENKGYFEYGADLMHFGSSIINGLWRKK